MPDGRTELKLGAWRGIGCTVKMVTSEESKCWIERCLLRFLRFTPFFGTIL